MLGIINMIQIDFLFWLPFLCGQIEATHKLSNPMPGHCFLPQGLIHMNICWTLYRFLCLSSPLGKWPCTGPLCLMSFAGKNTGLLISKRNLLVRCSDVVIATIAPSIYTLGHWHYAVNCTIIASSWWILQANEKLKPCGQERSYAEHNAKQILAFEFILEFCSGHESNSDIVLFLTPGELIWGFCEPHPCDSHASHLCESFFANMIYAVWLRHHHHWVEVI